jgi:surface antigen
MKFVNQLNAIAVCLALAACSGPGNAPKQDQGLVAGAVAGGVLGSQMGRGKGSVVGAVLGAVVGGVVGNEIGRSLDDRDRQMAQQAEFEAFDRGPPNEPVRWRNPNNGRYGEVVPGPYYRRGPQECREFTHTVYMDGRPRVMRGVACRNPDGTWSNVG